MPEQVAEVSRVTAGIAHDSSDIKNIIILKTSLCLGGLIIPHALLLPLTGCTELSQFCTMSR